MVSLTEYLNSIENQERGNAEVCRKHMWKHGYHMRKDEESDDYQIRHNLDCDNMRCNKGCPVDSKVSKRKLLKSELKLIEDTQHFLVSEEKMDEMCEKHSKKYKVNDPWEYRRKFKVGCKDMPCAKGCPLSPKANSSRSKKQRC